MSFAFQIAKPFVDCIVYVSELKQFLPTRARDGDKIDAVMLGYFFSYTQ